MSKKLLVLLLLAAGSSMHAMRDNAAAAAVVGAEDEALLVTATGSSAAAAAAAPTTSRRSAGPKTHWIRANYINPARAFSWDALRAALPAWHADCNDTRFLEQVGSFQSGGLLQRFQYRKRTNYWYGLPHTAFFCAVALIVGKKLLSGGKTRRVRENKELAA